MLKKIIIGMGLLGMMSSFTLALQPPTKLYIPIKKLYAAPTEESKVVFEIPIDVILTDVTTGERWYKVKIAYNFLGYHEYVGWAKIK